MAIHRFRHALLAAVVCALAEARAQSGSLTVTYDNYGIPHVDAATDAAAFFGAGWAVARDRWLQMCITRLTMDGKLAEYFGAGPGNEFLDSDKSARLQGWRRRANRVATQLPAEELGFLQAYADGVNHYLQSPDKPLHPLFAQKGIPANQLWTVSDCLLAWWRIAKEFSGDGLEEMLAVTKLLDAGLSSPPTPAQQAAAINALFAHQYRDDATAVLQPSDFAAPLVTQMQQYALSKGVSTVIPGAGPYVPSFSEAMVIGGNRMSDGVAALWGAPRIPVYAPNVGFECRMHGASFDVRGMCFPGSPIVLVGGTAHTAWSGSALGLDQADLFKITKRQSGYLYGGSVIAYDQVASETITVAGGAPVTVTYRLTKWGPIVKDDAEGTFAVCRVPLIADPSTTPIAVDTITAFVGLARATTPQAFTAALANWSFPSINMVFACSDGSVGYSMLGAIPVRAANVPFAGIVPLDGAVPSNAWQEFLPHALRPSAVRNADAVLFTANHLPIGTWYPMSAYIPGLGDTERSYRLRQILAAKGTDDFTPRNLDDLFRDAVRENVLGIHEIGEHIRATFPAGTLDADATEALDKLGAWIGLTLGAMQGGPTPAHAGVAVADRFARRIQIEGPQGPAKFPAYVEYGLGKAALNTFVRELRRKIGLGLSLDSDERTTVNSLLGDAIKAARVGTANGGFGSDPTVWGTLYDANVRTIGGPSSRVRIAEQGAPGFKISLIGSYLTQSWLTVATDVDTLTDQAGALFNHLWHVDGTGQRARSGLALGQSELPGDTHQFDQTATWLTGNIKDARLQTPATAPTFSHVYP